MSSPSLSSSTSSTTFSSTSSAASSRSNLCAGSDDGTPSSSAGNDTTGSPPFALKLASFPPESSNNGASNATSSSPPSSPPGDTDTLISVLKMHVETKPDQRVFTWLDSNGNESRYLSYAELWRQATHVVSMLRSNGIKQDDRVMIAYPFGVEFLAGMVGCMRAGVIPCSVYPPNPAKPSDLDAFRNQVKDSGATYALTTGKFKLYLGFRLIGSSGLGVKWLATDGKPSNSTVEYTSPTQDTTAFIQYTSGSTGVPKGVVISHRSLINNAHSCRVVGDLDSDKEQQVVVSWLPQYHDMGLLGFFAAILYSGVHGVCFSPIDFIKNPLLWHEAVVKYQAVSTLAPNFSYGLLIKRLQQSGKPHKKWTSIKTIFNGGEPVDSVVMDLVKSVLGVDETKIRVSYGLAELGVAAGWAKYTVTDNLVSTVPVDGTTSIHGPSRLRVVDTANESSPRAVADGTIGEIWIRAPSHVADGYWNKPELTNSAFRNKLQDEHGDWLSTGDLGKVIGDHIYVTGRLKEVIILNGRNVFPVDIERAVERAFPETLRPGCLVAFQNRADAVGLALEMRKGKVADEAPTVKELCTVVSENTGAALGYICILKSHSIPKTTSGKLKRVETRNTSLSNKWSKKDVVLAWSRDGPLTKPCDVLDATVVYNTIQDSLGFKVSPTDKLSELGMSSLKAVELHALLSEKLSLGAEDFPVTWLLEDHLTLSDIVDRLGVKEASPSSTVLTTGWNPGNQLTQVKQLLLPRTQQLLSLVVVVVTVGVLTAKLVQQHGPVHSLNVMAALAVGGILAIMIVKPSESLRPEAYIAATGVGFVGEKVSTDSMMQVIRSARADLGQDDDAISFSQQMAKSTGITTRHLALPVYHGNKDSSTGLSETLLSRLEGKQAHELTRAERSDIWWDVSQKASLASARAALNDWANKTHPAQRGNASDITHVITTTASGWREPGIAGHLIKELGLRHDVQKQELHMNGCFAAATCLRAARDIVRAGSNNSAAREGTSNVVDDGEGNTGRRCVLVVGVEVPSAHHDLTVQTREDILAMSLFCDGSGAAIIAPDGEWRFRESGCHVVPESKTLLGLQPDHPGGVASYKMTLSKEVPGAIYDYFSKGHGRRIMDRFEKAASGKHRPAMAVHPGGPRILGAVHKSIVERGWPDDALRRCEKTFFQRGNLGSTATLVVLHDILKDEEALRNHDDLGVLAFGPGVTVEYALLRRGGKN